jgi:hypothetical protein
MTPQAGDAGPAGKTLKYAEDLEKVIRLLKGAVSNDTWVFVPNMTLKEHALLMNVLESLSTKEPSNELAKRLRKAIDSLEAHDSMRAGHSPEIEGLDELYLIADALDSNSQSQTEALKARIQGILNEAFPYSAGEAESTLDFIKYSLELALVDGEAKEGK